MFQGGGTATPRKPQSSGPHDRPTYSHVGFRADTGHRVPQKEAEHKDLEGEPPPEAPTHAAPVMEAEACTLKAH